MKIDILLTHEVLDMAEVSHPGSGAVLRFNGVVRPQENDAAISALVYEAYEPMASQTIHSILAELHDTHGFDFVRMHHRLGTVPVGEAAIILEVSSKHRIAAISVVSDFMNRLKQDVPIWKVQALPK